MNTLPQQQTNHKSWLGYVLAGGLGIHFVNRILSRFGSIEEFYSLKRIDFEDEDFNQRLLDKFFDKKEKVDVDKTYEEIQERGIGILTIEDKEYPYLLKNIYDPPVVLFYKGDVGCLAKTKMLSVVGSHRTSSYAKDMVKRIVDGMPKESVIVSGMALGIDSSAHRAALDNNLKTVAVMGSGFDHLYPSKNKPMYEEILNDNGIIITEYLHSDEPIGWQFPKRNRIITGLSKGLLLAEAGQKSGALISAKLAIEQNREIMCIPGMSTNPNSYGPHFMIKNGAPLVENSQDVMDVMGWEATTFDSVEKGQISLPLDLSEEEIKIIEFITIEAKSVDDIENSCNIAISNLMVLLTKMELEGIVKQTSDGKYTRL